MKKQLVIMLCALFVIVSSIEAACMGGSCRKKQPRMHKEGSCTTGKCRQNRQ